MGKKIKHCDELAVAIGKANAAACADQLDAYDSQAAAFAAYLGNAGDTAIAEGLGDRGWQTAQSAFVAEVYRITGLEF
jgi:hypothetical protein